MNEFIHREWGHGRSMHARTVSAHVELSSARPAVGWISSRFWHPVATMMMMQCAQFLHSDTAPVPLLHTHPHAHTTSPLSLSPAQPISPSLRRRRSLLSPAEAPTQRGQFQNAPTLSILCQLACQSITSADCHSTRSQTASETTAISLAIKPQIPAKIF